MKQVLYFSAPWCPICREAYPTINELKKSGIQIKEINPDSNPEYGEKYNIKYLPTIVILKNNNVIYHHEGKLNLDKINQIINQ